MSLSTGARLGPYEIVAPLGAGGMGEVYRAKDARLNRTVAIKILSDNPQPMLIDASDSSAKRKRSPRSITPTSARSMTGDRNPERLHFAGTWNDACAFLIAFSVMSAR